MRDVAALIVTALLFSQASGAGIVPADCAMVKRVDPTFHSAMPVAKPDPKVHFTLRIVLVPSCKP